MILDHYNQGCCFTACLAFSWLSCRFQGWPGAQRSVIGRGRQGREEIEVWEGKIVEELIFGLLKIFGPQNHCGGEAYPKVAHLSCSSGAEGQAECGAGSIASSPAEGMYCIQMSSMSRQIPNMTSFGTLSSPNR